MKTSPTSAAFPLPTMRTAPPSRVQGRSRRKGVQGRPAVLSWLCTAVGSKSSEAFLREQRMTDTHSPDQFRPVTVRNLDAWHAAFDVKPGDKLYLAPADRVHIW